MKRAAVALLFIASQAVAADAPIADVVKMHMAIIAASSCDNAAASKEYTAYLRTRWNEYMAFVATDAGSAVAEKAWADDALRIKQSGCDAFRREINGRFSKHPPYIRPFAVRDSI